MKRQPGDIYWTKDHGSPVCMITMADRDIRYCRWIWIQKHGEVPPGHIVTQVNGDAKDFSADNIVCLTVKEHCTMHNRKRMGKQNARGLDRKQRTDSDDEIGEDEGPPPADYTGKERDIRSKIGYIEDRPDWITGFGLNERATRRAR